MVQLRITSVSLFKWTVAFFAIPTVLLLLIACLIVFLTLGGGWAYAGPAGCHFVLNPLGVAMLAGAALGFSAFLYSVGRRVVRRYQAYNARVDS